MSYSIRSVRDPREDEEDDLASWRSDTGDIDEITPLDEEDLGPIDLGSGLPFTRDRSGYRERRAREKRQAEDTVADEADERRRFYDDLGRQYQGVPGDPATQERADGLFGVRNIDITAAEMDASRAFAGGYSRRGLSGSGYAAGSQSQALQAAAAERSRARAAALDRAISEGREGILGNANIAQKGDPFLMNLVQFEQQKRLMQMQQDEADSNQFKEFLARGAGAVAGFYLGGPMGAAAGYKAGDALVGGGGGGGYQAPPYYLQDPTQYPGAPQNYYDPSFSFLDQDGRY